MEKISLSLKRFSDSHYTEDKTTDFIFIPRVDDHFMYGNSYYKVQSVILNTPYENQEYIAKIHAFEVNLEDIVF